ncbi:MAG: hypothetical protein IKI51_00120, partial [Clostridia bacterium]|nr:hypothetical protein [Clostridia bacterium]
MKKIIILALSVLCLLLVLVSCGNTPAAPTEATETAEPDECAIYGHEYQQTVVKPTCAAEGYTEHKCIHCGDTYKDNYKAKLKHTYEIVSSIEATCSAEGYTEHKCIHCGDTYKDNFKAKLNHTYEIVPSIEATCTSEGLTKSKRCYVCGEIVTPQEKTPKLPHTPTLVMAVLPTTTSEGTTSGHICAFCGEALDGFEPIPKLTVSAQNDAKELKVDFNEFKENLNEMRREYTANFEYPE